MPQDHRLGDLTSNLPKLSKLTTFDRRNVLEQKVVDYLLERVITDYTIKDGIVTFTRTGYKKSFYEFLVSEMTLKDAKLNFRVF